MGSEPNRGVLPHWPRLMSAPLAAGYLSLSETTVREHGPKPKRYGKRVLYDRADLDRWADALGDQPLDEGEREAETAEVERRFMEKRRGRG